MKSLGKERKKIQLIHIGKKCPKGFKEVSGQHLGKGVWALTCEEIHQSQERRSV